jgi:ribosomal protein S18 acetylase RimI-like enzyme
MLRLLTSVPGNPQHKMVNLLKLTTAAEVERYSAKMSEWVFETSAQLFVSLFGDGDIARRALQQWICRRSSEFSGLSATMAFSDSCPAGLVIALPGGEISGRRRADLLALIAMSAPERRAILRDQLRDLSNATARVGPADYYIRTLAVASKYRRSGIGRTLIEQALADGQAAGLRCFRLDVESDNEAAINLYRSLGFSQFTKAASARRLRGYSMVLER